MVKSGLQYFKLINNLYNDIVIAIDDIPPELLSPLDESSELNECEYIEEANDENIEEQEAPLDKMRVTFLISHIPCVQDEENITIIVYLDFQEKGKVLLVLPNILIGACCIILSDFLPALITFSLRIL